MSIRTRRISHPPRKLLIIEGDQRLLASYRDLLVPYGFEVLTAADEDHAINLVTRHPDIMLIIVDVPHEPVHARDWLRWFRGACGDSPVILISPKAIEPEPELGLSACLEKPFHVAELLDLVGLFCGLGTPPITRVI